MIKQDENLLGQPIPSNEMGNATPVFPLNQAANAQYIFGTSPQRQASMPIREGSAGCCQDM